MTLLGCICGPLAAAAAPLVAPPLPDLTGVEAPVAAKLRAARRYVELNPDSAHAWGVLAMNLDVHGFKDEAGGSYQSAAALDPDELRWPYLGAILLAERGAVEAVEWFERARRLRPDYAPLLVRLGQAQAAAGRVQAAREAFSAAATADPGLSHAYLGLGRIALSLGDLEACKRQAQKAVKVSPRHGEAHGLLAEVYRRLGSGEEAERELKVMHLLPRVSRLPDPVYTSLVAEGVSSYWFRQRGRAHLERGDFERAAQEFRQGLSHGELPELHNELGFALQGQGLFEEAIEHHQAALRLRPDYPEALNYLGEGLYELGQLQPAIAAVERALEIQPDLAVASLNLGTFQLRLRQRSEAQTAWRHGLVRSPDNLLIAGRLAWLLSTARESELRDGEEAVRLAEAVCNMTGYRLPEALDVLAAAYAEAGRFDEAVETAGRARRLAASEGRLGLAQEIESRIALYAMGRAYREGEP